MNKKRVRYITGLDLGPPHEPTAMALLEESSGSSAEARYSIRHLERFTPGTSYPAIVEHVTKMFKHPILSNSMLVVDQTAVGRPVVELLRQARIRARLSIVTITAGHKATCDAGLWLVPKQELVGTLQVLLQTRRLTIAPDLPDAALLLDELTQFKMKLPVMNDALAWRDRPHDDLLLATALATWTACRNPMQQPFAPYVVG